MPKNLTAIAATLFIAFALSGCTPASAPEPADERPLVLTTFTVLADMARNVAGDHLRVESITKLGAEIHGYEPTPGDLRHAADAALILDNGLGLEAWFEKLLASAEAPHVTLSDAVEQITIEGAVGTANPHAWMSALNAQLYVDAISAAFSELDPANAGDYAANASAYKAELQDVHDDLLRSLDTIPPAHRVLVTCEGAFSYLARDVGLEEHYLWPVNAESEATPQRIAAVIDVVRERDVPAVFCESTVSDRAMQQVVAATDTAFGGILYVDSLSDAAGPVPTYLDLLRHDGAVIVSALSAGTP